jgi:uncharacterized protein YuzE
MTIKLAGIEFDNNFYDREVDVLYLHVGDASTSVDWADTEEGDGVSYAADGSLVGVTILNARWRLDRDGKIVLTMPEQRVETTDLADALAPA